MPFGTVNLLLPVYVAYHTSDYHQNRASSNKLNSEIFKTSKTQSDTQQNCADNYSSYPGLLQHLLGYKTVAFKGFHRANDAHDQDHERDKSHGSSKSEWIDCGYRDHDDITY